jgi:hypothetical protein
MKLRIYMQAIKRTPAHIAYNDRNTNRADNTTRCRCYQCSSSSQSLRVYVENEIAVTEFYAPCTITHVRTPSVWWMATVIMLCFKLRTDCYFYVIQGRSELVGLHSFNRIATTVHRQFFAIIIIIIIIIVYTCLLTNAMTVPCTALPRATCWTGRSVSDILNKNLHSSRNQLDRAHVQLIYIGSVMNTTFFTWFIVVRESFERWSSAGPIKFLFFFLPKSHPPLGYTFAVQTCTSCNETTRIHVA